MAPRDLGADACRGPGGDPRARSGRGRAGGERAARAGHDRAVDGAPGAHRAPLVAAARERSAPRLGQPAAGPCRAGPGRGAGGGGGRRWPHQAGALSPLSAPVGGGKPHRRELKVIPYACRLHAAACSMAGNTSARPVSQARMVVSCGSRRRGLSPTKRRKRGTPVCTRACDHVP